MSCSPPLRVPRESAGGAEACVRVTHEPTKVGVAGKGSHLHNRGHIKQVRGDPAVMQRVAGAEDSAGDKQVVNAGRGDGLDESGDGRRDEDGGPKRSAT